MAYLDAERSGANASAFNVRELICQTLVRIDMTLRQGQANHFYRYAPEKIEYGIKRYQTETKRLYQVLEDRLIAQSKTATGTDGPWLVGDKMTIADIASFSWINWAEWAGVDVTPFKNLHGWLERINARPAVKRGLDVPEPFTMKEKLKSKVKL